MMSTDYDSEQSPRPLTAKETAFWENRPEYSLNEAAYLFRGLLPIEGADVDPVDVAVLKRELRKSVKSGELRGEANKTRYDYGRGIAEFEEMLFNRGALRSWAEAHNERPAFLFPPEAEFAKPSGLRKSEKQDRAVSAAIEKKGWEPLSVPDGQKGALEALCKTDYPELFKAETAFETTWKRGLKAGRWRMQSYASYAKRSRW